MPYYWPRGDILESLSAGWRRTFLRLSFCASLLFSRFFSPGFTLEHYAKLFGERAYMQALRNTAEISIWVTVLSLVLGYPLAYLMTVVSGRARTLLIVLVLVPFWTSVLVRTFAWMVILGKRGIINQLLIGWGVIDRPLALIYNMLGVQIGMVHVLEGYRRKGLAHSVVAAVSREPQRLGKRPTLHAYVDNVASLSLFPTLGFRKVKRQVWGDAVFR